MMNKSIDETIKRSTYLYSIFCLLICLMVYPQDIYAQPQIKSAAELIKQGKIYEEQHREKEALKLYKQAAEMNDPEGMFLYGDMLRFGDSSLAEKKEGYNWIEKAAKAGYKEAIPVIGWMYFNGGESFDRDYEKAYPYLEEAADYDPEANLLLGKMFFYGLGVEQNYQKAIKYLLKSETNWGDANYLLAQSYALGLGTEENTEVAQKYWKALVKDPSREALFSIGHSFYYGVLTKQDYNQAAKYLQQSASQNYWPALFLLSKCYRFGRGVPEDIPKANQLLEEAKYGDYDALLVTKMMKDN